MTTVVKNGKDKAILVLVALLGISSGAAGAAYLNRDDIAKNREINAVQDNRIATLERVFADFQIGVRQDIKEIKLDISELADRRP